MPCRAMNFTLASFQRKSGIFEGTDDIQVRLEC